MDIERFTFPGRPTWVRAVLFSGLVVTAWFLLGALWAIDLVPYLLGAPAILVLVLSPLGMALVFRRGGPEFGAMVAVGVALTVTGFAVPGDAYLNAVGSPLKAKVVAESCDWVKGTCSRRYRLEDGEGRTVDGLLKHGPQRIGDEVEVRTDPAGVIPPRRTGETGFGFLDLVALLAWLGWFTLIVQGLRADRSRTAHPG
ncbi:hypothetical protein [Actinocorallia longicatena]|uniref:DUF3592 domain-containing protein n=1 Tax=Actinocorallia longicatena TaxID=111803 RepID=A0ABP6Q7H4_9ACTN